MIFFWSSMIMEKWSLPPSILNITHTKNVKHILNESAIIFWLLCVSLLKRKLISYSALFNSCCSSLRFLTFCVLFLYYCFFFLATMDHCFTKNMSQINLNAIEFCPFWWKVFVPWLSICMPLLCFLLFYYLTYNYNLILPFL